MRINRSGGGGIESKKEQKLEKENSSFSFGSGPLLVALVIPTVALAATGAAGLTVGPSGRDKGLDPEVSPGESHNQTLVVGIAPTDVATDVVIEVLGYAENVDQRVHPIPAEDDKSPYSARTFIKPGQITLHLEPGETKPVDVTLSIPGDVGDGGRYATLRFATALPDGAAVKIVSAIVLPLRFTIKGSQLIHQGKIIALTTGESISGKPTDIITSFRNTGNHHFTPKQLVEIRDASGKVIDTIQTSALSTIPDGTRRLKINYTPRSESPSGVYSVKSMVMLEDGTVLDEASGSFEVKHVYVPPTPVGEGGVGDGAPGTVTPPSQTNWLLIGGVILIGVGLAALFLIRRRASQ